MYLFVCTNLEQMSTTTGSLQTYVTLTYLFKLCFLHGPTSLRLYFVRLTQNINKTDKLTDLI